MQKGDTTNAATLRDQPPPLGGAPGAVGCPSARRRSSCRLHSRWWPGAPGCGPWKGLFRVKCTTRGATPPTADTRGASMGERGTCMLGAGQEQQQGRHASCGRQRCPQASSTARAALAAAAPTSALPAHLSGCPPGTGSPCSSTAAAARRLCISSTTQKNLHRQLTDEGGDGMGCARPPGAAVLPGPPTPPVPAHLALPRGAQSAAWGAPPAAPACAPPRRRRGAAGRRRR